MSTSRGRFLLLSNPSLLVNNSRVAFTLTLTRNCSTNVCVFVRRISVFCSACWTSILIDASLSHNRIHTYIFFFLALSGISCQSRLVAIVTIIMYMNIVSK